jgi:hypothetical protein
MNDQEQIQNRLNAFLLEWQALKQKYGVDFNAVIISDQLQERTLPFVNDFLRLNNTNLTIQPQMQLVTDPNWKPGEDSIPPDPPGEPKRPAQPAPKPPIPAKRNRKRK